MATHRKSTDSVEDACTKLLILRNPIVAHALLRAVFALLRTPVATEPKRSQECERGTQECVRHGASSSPLVGQQAHGNSLTVAVR
jgi:hypothetical protein